MSYTPFTRSLYDGCALEKKNQESTDPFKWVTDASVVESKTACFLGASPFQHNQFKSIPTDSIDIESDLRGQTRVLSKCPEDKFNPFTSKKYQYSINECKDESLVPQYTRLNKACNIFSGITINRFSPLCDDLQDLNKIHSNTYIGTNTRLQVKDAFQKASKK